MLTGQLGDFPHHDEYQIRTEQSGNGLYYWEMHDRDTDVPLYGSRCGYPTEEAAADAARYSLHVHPVNLITSNGNERIIS